MEPTRLNMTNRAQYHERVLKTFWSQWKREYLTSLRQFYGQKSRLASDVSVKKSDVLVHDNIPRINAWKLGVVTEIFEGWDGLVRSFYLRTASGHLRRPIEKLYPLEVTEELMNPVPEKDKQEGATRILRGSAERAKETIRQQLSEN